MPTQPSRFDPADSPPQSEPRLMNRDRIERILRLAELLEPRDRLLLEAVLDRGLSTSEVASLTDRSSSWVRRQVHRLMQRLESPHVIWILREANNWPPLRGRIARARFIAGLSQRQTARCLGVSLHRVREQDHLLREQFNALEDLRSRAAAAAAHARRA